ncbi:MAG: polysaccharide biosynthesis tyrosine autokinase [Candidatus Omnitrophica bacterium]|nr:polysaccharide biosynthesis tyrosine autokinase [Candidatus Omnitrophota bacterium]
MTNVGYNLSDYWLILRKRKWVAIFTFLAVFLSTIFHTQMQPPVYKASCSIRLIERRSVADMITSMVSHTSYSLMSSLPRILVGRPVIEKVVYELGLADENTPPQELENNILAIQGTIITKHEMGTNIIHISVEHSDAEMAARIANTVAKVFIRIDMEEKNEQARNVRIFIEGQLSRSKQGLIEAENQLKIFKEKEKEKEQVSGIAIVIQNNISELERKKIELKKIYTEEYPDVVKINEQIEDLRQQLQILPESEIEYAQLVREYEVNERSYRILLIKLEDSRIVEAEKVQDVKIVNPATVPKAPIKPKKEMATALGFAVGLVLALFIAFVVETLDTSIGTIGDLESLLGLPVLAVIPYLKPKVKRKGSLWGWLTTPLFGFKGKRKKSSEGIENMKEQLLIKYAQKSTTTEAYRILRTNMKVDELLESDQRILLFTSTVPEEGKSITAINTALALAQDGYRTLLVDCDLRKASIHRVFSTDKEPGLTDILLGVSKPEIAIRNLIDMMINDIDIKDALKAPGLDNFSFLTCGKIVANPAELLDSVKISELFSNLRTQYKFIVVDSPPVLPVPDTIILGKKIANRLYLIYRAGRTSRIALLRAKEQLGMMKTVPSGVILNSTTPESQIVSDYYHHYYHYKYYSEEEKK